MLVYKEISDIKFIAAKDELAYQEVIDDFKNAKKVFVLTYNVSKSKNSLLSAFKECGEDTKVTIISNIPSRWNEYFNSYYAEKARENISIYKNKLNPKDIADKADVYFCFVNHSKIVMTDNIVYIGSSNFSDESSNNIENGFISRDKEFIDFLEEELFPWVIEYSSEYEMDNNLLFLEAAIQKSISMIYGIYEEYYMCFYSLADHRGTERWYYNTTEDLISVDKFEETISILHKYLELLEKVNSIFNKAMVSNDIDNIDDIIEDSNKIVRRIEDLCNIELHELASFNRQSYIDDYLNEYYAEAYDENLDYYVDAAIDKANEAFYDISIESHKMVDELLGEFDKMKKISNDVLERFKSIPKALLKIDNTK
ncbi:hypothetical protein H8J89_05360 [Clostridium perfringens]|uniref:phospholipase D-like domain-containing protein n=1 Tax=Clostridium perfringens TaxID=1502 RepID=UPI0018E49E5D|nr:hypothetical protein [Clostridium perfringens]MBI6093056.1 hypothetical protein [Clostridium perfringens]